MKSKEQHIDAIFGFDGASQMLRDEGIDALARKLNEHELERKQLDKTQEDDTEKTETTETTEAASELNEEAVNAVFSEVVDAQGGLAEDVDEIKSLLDTQQKAYDTKVGELESQVKAFKAEMNELREELSLTSKRASQDPATKLSGADERELKAVKTNNDANQYDPFFEDMKIPVKGGA